MQPLPHHYEVRLRGAAAGPTTVSLAGAPDIEAAPPADFGGPGDAWGPEHLLLAAREAALGVHVGDRERAGEHGGAG